MKKIFHCVGIITLLLIIGFLFIACYNGNGTGNDDDNNPNEEPVIVSSTNDDPGTEAPTGEPEMLPPTNGSLTITGLDAYNNRYVLAVVDNDEPHLYAAENMNLTSNIFYGGTISNGTTVLKVWEMIFENGNPTFKAYNGNHQDVELDVLVLSKSTFSNNDIALAEGTLSAVDFINGEGNSTVINLLPVATVALGGGVTGIINIYDEEEDNDYIEIMPSTVGNSVRYTIGNNSFLTDFKIFIDDEEITFPRINYGTGIMLISNDDLFAAGEQYEIRIIYEANPSNPIQLGDREWEGPILASFDTGVKTIAAREDLHGIPDDEPAPDAPIR
jgi:hypothetical protein